VDVDEAINTTPGASPIRLRGEVYGDLPRDLFIPPEALEVFLEAFEGPLDLLLYLIKRQNIDILDIPIADITRQYMDYLGLMEEVRLELAAEYLVMASTLAEIKSRLLLPRPSLGDDGQEEDPRAELVRRLQEYERYKQAAEDLDALPRLDRDIFTAGAEVVDREVRRIHPEVSLDDLAAALKGVLERSEHYAHHHIRRETLSVRERMGQLLETLQPGGFMPFAALFSRNEGSLGVVVTLLAVLELIRESLLELVQAEPFAPIHVRLRG
jgi:segregation and condensation protein A